MFTDYAEDETVLWNCCCFYFAICI